MAQTSDEQRARSTTDIGDVSEFSKREGETLRLEGITKTFGGGTVIAAEDVNITVEPDEFVVLVGPSGCGKTTTLRCISGLEIPDGGTVMLGDKDITNHAPKDRDLAYVFQSIALFPHMTVRKNMRFGLDMATSLDGQEKERRVRDVAKILQIDDYLDRSTSDLSGGQQQRVSIGRAMVMEPAAFLLDEPFSNLDANLRDEMQTEVKKLQRNLNRAMIFVTHDQAEAMTLADKIVIMRDGTIQQQGSPYEIYNDPANEFVARFIGSPSTNMIRAHIESRGSNVALVTESFEVTLSSERSDMLASHIGESVYMGIRPEYLRLGESNEAVLTNVKVTLVEPEGARDTIHLEVGGLELVAAVRQGQVRADESFDVSFDRDQIWVFDETGERIA
ncbi:MULTISPECIES: ABC transporter ATP-binding protein [unclassified Haladaptatus]|uniref:ABC transporter ATP-binding protein n=1 Tax=unclassified Haladaptatus TaxID=2622732 RepID=UPI0023E871A6|nr:MULTISPECIES: ABC transporter ATP-binding protein [unclassified Haladaptatus]